jgi:hypothetical protein
MHAVPRFRARALLLRRQFFCLILAASIAITTDCALGQSVPRGIYVCNEGSGNVGKYDTNGASVNPSLISGLLEPEGVAVSGADLYISSFGNNNGVIGKYSLWGDVVNPSLVTGLFQPVAVAVSGTDLFVSNAGTTQVGKYTTSGGTINPAFISVQDPAGLAVSGSDLYVASGFGTVGRYDTSSGAALGTFLSGLGPVSGITISGTDLYVVRSDGTRVSRYSTVGAGVTPFLITGLHDAYGIAASDDYLYVTTFYPNSTISVYTKSGVLVTSSLVPGLSRPFGIALDSGVPEPGGACLVIACLIGIRPRRRRKA